MNEAVTGALDPNHEQPPVIKVPMYYASQFLVQSGGVDVTFVFSKHLPTLRSFEPDGTLKYDPSPPPVQPQCAVTLAPGTAKDLLVILSDVVQQHEALYGEIRTPTLETRKASQQGRTPNG